MIAARLPLLPADTDQSTRTRWFSAQGCVVHHEDWVEVFIAGSLISSYEHGDRGARNVVLVGLALDPQVHLGKLADAFDVTAETLRLIRRQAETDGLDAVLGHGRGGVKKSPAFAPVQVRPAGLVALCAPVVVTTPAGVRIEVGEVDAATAAWVVAVLGGEGRT